VASDALCFFRIVKDRNSLAKKAKHKDSTQLRLCLRLVVMVEVNGIEPMTSCLQSRRSPN
jgi:hypothetical protein